MSFWDDVKINMNAAVQCAGDKAGQLAELARLKMNIAGLNRALNEKYALVGRRAYRAHEKGDQTDGAIELLFREIAELRRARRLLEEQVEEIKKVAVCEECSAENPNTAEYCTKCGEKL